MGLYVFFDNLQVLRMVAEQCESARLHRHVAKRYAYASQACIFEIPTLISLVQHLQKTIKIFYMNFGFNFLKDIAIKAII